MTQGAQIAGMAGAANRFAQCPPGVA
ncbi:MAG: hypothetical protein RLZZ08_650, partial [Pseudomonadota bacterium]